MADIKRSWDIISEEKRKESINKIITFFQTERNEKIGIIAAEDILDYFLENFSLEIYNKGVEDSVNYLKERFESLELDLESLKKETK